LVWWRSNFGSFSTKGTEKGNFRLCTCENAFISSSLFTSGSATDFHVGSHFSPMFWSQCSSGGPWTSLKPFWFLTLQGWVSSPWKLAASLDPSPPGLGLFSLEACSISESLQFRCFVATCLCSCSSVVLGLWSPNSLNLESHIHYV